MTKTANLVAVAAALMIGAAIPAQALDLSIGDTSVSAGSGGSDSGGTSVSLGSGDTSTGVTVGGGSNVASVGASTGGTSANVGIGNTSGDLVTLDQNGGTTTGNVNLGGLGLGGGANNLVNGVTGPLGTTLDGVNLGGLPGTGGPGAGGGGGAGGGVVAAFNSLTTRDQQALRIQCRTVLSNPSAFNRNTVALCSLVGRL